jgi:hypothetical protein
MNIEENNLKVKHKTGEVYISPDENYYLCAAIEDGKFALIDLSDPEEEAECYDSLEDLDEEHPHNKWIAHKLLIG